ncbi:MAG TPA: hypothetical protein DDW51_04340 [Cyanobacteria bacterium UBA11367]|nr:hypothetical protein [Cyanobacteria bacterium UBA11367]HBS72656.1 hypothetical protein [Cyanobacteria bacterium UBA11153]
MSWSYTNFPNTCYSGDSSSPLLRGVGGVNMQRHFRELVLLWGNLIARKGLTEKVIGQSNYYGMASPPFDIAGLVKDVETFVNLS